MPDYSGHITHDEYISIIQQKVLGMARDVLDDKIGVVQACLQMAPILYELDLSGDDDFGVIIGVDSECEYMVFGEAADLNPPLAQQDSHIRACEEGNRAALQSACGELLRRYGRSWTISQKQDDL